MRKRKFLCSITILILVLTPCAANFSVYQAIQHRLKIKVEGKFIPSLFAPSFKLQDARFTWKDRVRMKSGELKVRYGLWPVSPGKIRLTLASSNLQIELLGDWARSQGVSVASLNKFETIFDLGERGIEEVETLEARGPQFQFLIKESEK